MADLQHPWTGRSAAGRQAALVFAFFGAIALAGAFLPWTPNMPLLIVAGVDALLAVIVWRLPWHRWPSQASLVLVPIALAVVAYGEWHIDTGSGVAAFLALLFTWIGLHHARGAALATAPFALVASIGPLLATGAPAANVYSAFLAVAVVALVGELVGWLVTGLRAANRTLMDTDTWRARLMATFAHDVRAPLAVVTATFDHLDQDDGHIDPALQKAILRSARRQADRVNGLAADLLDADRVEHGVLRLAREPVPVVAAIDRALTLIDATRARVDADGDLTAHADPGRLEQMLVNLLTNAQQHGTPPILISVDRGDDEIHITVRDHGPGVAHPPDSAAFTPYRSYGDSSDSPHLGLWLTQALSEAHGGRLSYRGAEPGAAFTLTLPASPAREAAAARPRRVGVAAARVARGTSA